MCEPSNFWFPAVGMARGLGGLFGAAQLNASDDDEEGAELDDVDVGLEFEDVSAFPERFCAYVVREIGALKTARELDRKHIEEQMEKVDLAFSSIGRSLARETEGSNEATLIVPIGRARPKLPAATDFEGAASLASSEVDYTPCSMVYTEASMDFVVRRTSKKNTGLSMKVNAADATQSETFSEFTVGTLPRSSLRSVPRLHDSTVVNAPDVQCLENLENISVGSDSNERIHHEQGYFADGSNRSRSPRDSRALKLFSSRSKSWGTSMGDSNHVSDWESELQGKLNRTAQSPRKQKPGKTAAAQEGSMRCAHSSSGVGSASCFELAETVGSWYRLRASIWDATLLLGLPGVSRSSNLLLFAGLLVNIVVQVLLGDVRSSVFSRVPATVAEGHARGPSRSVRGCMFRREVV